MAIKKYDNDLVILSLSEFQNEKKLQEVLLNKGRYGCRLVGVTPIKDKYNERTNYYLFFVKEYEF